MIDTTESNIIHFALSISCGNDSIALVQYLLNKGYEPKRMIAVYCNTGWAAPEWPERVAAVKKWLMRVGIGFYETESEGFEALVLKNGIFPIGKKKFCTRELKIKPFFRLLKQIDPSRSITVCVGIRREESEARRNFPEYAENEKFEQWAPMVQVLERERDALIRQAGFEVLPHRSKECSPCIHANRGDLRLVSESQVEKVEALEKAVSEARGCESTMFNSKDKMGAVGIREVIKWAKSERGKYKKGEISCDGGFCGG